jgi:predicted PurR-regulated permease PerM
VHPLAVIFGVLAGGEIAGIAGIYFAVPLMSAARILWINWRRHNSVGAALPEAPPQIPVQR